MAGWKEGRKEKKDGRKAGGGGEDRVSEVGNEGKVFRLLLVLVPPLPFHWKRTSALVHVLSTCWYIHKKQNIP